MPDGDIFYKLVPRKWVKASRLAFGAEEDAIAIAECEKVLARDLNERPWNELASAVHDIAAALTGDDDVVNRRRVLSDLEWFRDKWPALRYDAMRRVTNRLLTRGSDDFVSMPPNGMSEDSEIRVAVELLAETISSSITPACKAAQLEQADKMGVRRFHERGLEMRKLLREAPGLRIVAEQLLRTPNDSGRQIRAPRTRSNRLSQSELVELPIG